MTQKENPTAKGRASCNLFGDKMPDALTLSAYRAQHIAVRYAVPLETAAILAALAFGGAHYG